VTVQSIPAHRTPTSAGGSPAQAGRVWRFADDVDTDVMAPGRYMKFGIEQIAAHCLESLRAEFPSQVHAGDLVVAGRNFGVGSSREQAPQALVHLGVGAVIAVSFAGLFYRNALNVGLAVLVCPEAGEIPDGSLARLDLRAACIEVPAIGRSFACEPIPAFLLEMLSDGGLVPHLRRRLHEKAVS